MTTSKVIVRSFRVSSRQTRMYVLGWPHDVEYCSEEARPLCYGLGDMDEAVSLGTLTQSSASRNATRA
jgi:hypothetical protein